MAELRSFVFAVSFIVLFGALLSSVPVDYQGQGTPNDPIITPIDPNLLTDFSDSEPWNTTDFVPFFGPIEIYEYELNSREWISVTNGSYFDLSSKIYWLGIWLGQLDTVRFKNLQGVDRSLSITFDEMEADSEDGVARYTLVFADSGNSAGGFIFYWNETLYSDPSDAWDNDVLYFLHGVGISTDANIVNLLLSLLFLQLPQVPFLISVLLATTVWSMIIYLLWFIIISMVPFLGGA